MARRAKVTEPESTNTEEASGEQEAPSKIEWPRILLCPFPNCGVRQASSALVEQKPGIKACMKCGAGLTPMNRAPVPALDTPAESGDVQKTTPLDLEKHARESATPTERVSEPRPGGGSRATMPGRSPRDVAAPNPEDVGETVSATWGEELYTPQQFFAFRIGPFTRSTKIRDGETAVTAKQRIYSELKQMADDERETKMRIFIDAMGFLFKTVKGDKS